MPLDASYGWNPTTPLVEIEAVVYFNSAGITTTSPTCNMRMDDSASSIAGFSAAGDDPYFNQPH